MPPPSRPRSIPRRRNPSHRCRQRRAAARAGRALKHDNRLQLAIRKLRRAIETDPSRPELLVTTEEGYALAGAARRLKSP